MWLFNHTGAAHSPSLGDCPMRAGQWSIMSGSMGVPRLFLIDTFGLIFRAYHARARSAAPPMRTSSGIPTEVTFIFNNMLRKILAAQKPGYVAAVFESAVPTFREQEFAEYKANRPEAPPDLLQQIPYVRRLLDALHIPVLEFPGFEADDVIGTLSSQASRAGAEVVIVSSDKDMLQLVDDQVKMLNPAKDDAVYDVDRVKDFMGVGPAQVPDLLALKGDAVDNIPGAPGIGDKGARDLIAQFGTVEQLLDRAEEVQRKTYRESLLGNRAQVELSKRLATIARDVPIDWSLDSLAVQPPDLGALREVYNELEFFSLLKELPEPSVSAPALDISSFGSAEECRAWLEALPPETAVAVAFHDSPEPSLGSVALGLSARSGEARGLTIHLLAEARPFLEDPARPKAGCDVKSLLVGLAAHGIEARGFRDDLMLYAFLLTADPAACSLGVIASKYLNRWPGTSPEEEAETCFTLAPLLREEIASRQFRSLYEAIDLPLTAVLARMERHGIRIAPAALKALAGRMESEMESLTADIYDLAGHGFNINSPQQLSRVLFDELGLPAPPRQGKTKSLSTAADVLEGLAAEHPIAAKVLEFRQISKLKGTYVDALPALINPATGRLHTTFNPAGAATGRLSSSNPNLQNIPIRTELGREIRAAFIPESGWKLVVADYSQIELRLLAHFSGDPVLVDAFRRGEDIHTRTAAEVFGVMPMMVTPELRRNAKAVNFGIVYGLSAFGLAAQLGIPRQEAESYIRGYFERYAGVRRFIDETIKSVRRTGVTRTLFGRERPIPDIDSRNPNARGFAERTAVNTPLQGTAADLIKLAMIAIHHRLGQEGLRSRMLLQVHDELVFEAPPEEVPALSSLVKQEMENVHKLDVPLLVEIGVGDNWRDAK